jgi:hypothetical protein
MAHVLRPVLVLLAALALAACSTDIPVASFDPASPCDTDGRFAGAYPDLEGALPTEYEGASPANVDSGRNCTATALGTLATAGVDGVRFAGATWDLGGTAGLTVAVFEGASLDTTKLAAFYEDGARRARRTDRLVAGDTIVGGKPARRLDVLGTDGSGQTVVVWPADEPDRVNVLLAGNLGDAKVLEAIETFGDR